MKAYRESIIVGRFVWSLLPLSADTRFRGPPCYPVLFASGKLHMDHSMLTHRSRCRLSPVMRANLIFLSYSFSDEIWNNASIYCECTVLFIFTTSQECGAPYSHQSLDIVKMCTIIPVRIHVYTKWLHQNLRNWKPKLNNTDFKPLYYLRLFFVTKCKLSISLIPNFKNNHQKW